MGGTANVIARYNALLQGLSRVSVPLSQRGGREFESLLLHHLKRWQSSNSGTAAFLVFKCVWDIEMRAWFWIVGCSVGYGFACQYAAAFPAQHIRSALSLAVAVSAAHAAPCGPFGRFASLAAALRFAPAHFRRRRVPAGRRVRMRRDLPSPGSVGIPPIAGSAAPRLPPSASPAVTTSASCRRLAVPLRSFEAAHQYGIKFD